MKKNLKNKPITSWHGFLFSNIDRFFLNLLNMLIRLLDYFRHFIDSQEGLFELFFLLIYFAEQIVLLILLNNSRNPSLVVGIFVAILLTTISIEKVLLKSRSKRLALAKMEAERDFQTAEINFINSYNNLANAYDTLKEGYVNLESEHDRLLNE